MSLDSITTDPSLRRLARAAGSRSAREAPRERVLLLTSGLGHGHVRAAQAVEAALVQRAIEVRTLDLWSLMNPGAASIVHQTYLRLVQEYPELYERLYQLDQHTWRQILESEAGPPPHVLEVLELISEIAAGTAADAGGVHYATDRLLLPLLYNSLPYNGASLAGNGVRARLAIMKWSWLRLSKRLESIVTDYAPDVVVSTQMIPAAMISALKRRGRLHVPVIGVLTDYGLHDFWCQRGIDRYCIAHESIAAQAGDLSDAAVVTGVPLMPAFAQPLAQAEARRQLDLDPRRQYVLILGGGLGLSVEAIAARLLERSANYSLIVMPGKNSSARLSLSQQIAKRDPKNPGAAHDRVHIFDWTDRMDVFIRAADVVVGKPGGVSVAEVLACGRPLLATRSLGGQEGFNVRFLEQHKVGALVADDELAARIETMLDAGVELADVQQRAWRLGMRDGAARVAELTLDLIARRRFQAAHEVQ